MHAADLEAYLHEHIPLSRAIQVAVLAADADTVALRAPLAPNVNHRDTVFGGSASALAILAAWSLLHVRLRGAGLERRLVIQRNTMEYLQPMAGDFEARAHIAPESWAAFTRTLARKGRARIEVAATLHCAGVEAGRLSGEFVALPGGAA